MTALDALLLLACLAVFEFNGTLSCPRMCSCDNYATFHEINCDSQDLNAFPPGIPEWTTELSFDGNYLTTLDLTFFDITTYYEVFSIRYNEIKRFKLSNHTSRKWGLRGACNYVNVIFPRLKRVNLRGNALRKLPKCLLFSWPKLQILKLDENEIARFEDLNLAHHPANSGSLKELSLRRNRVTKIARGELYTPSIVLRNLTVLDLGENQIESLDSASFLFIKALVEVKLDRNRIRRVPPFAFVTIGRKTEIISLARNRISWIATDAFAGLPALERLDISGNSIQCLMPRTFSTCHPSLPAPEDPAAADQVLLENLASRYENDLRALRVVEVRDNDWVCDCLLNALVVDQNLLSRQMRTERCARPASLERRLIFSALQVVECPE